MHVGHVHCDYVRKIGDHLPCQAMCYPACSLGAYPVACHGLGLSTHGMCKDHISGRIQTSYVVNSALTVLKNYESLQASAWLISS